MTMPITTETDAQVLARLISNGGKILVVGGNIADNLPERMRQHPAIVVWDDDRQGVMSREIPSNTRAILWNRWISHSLVARLNIAATKLRALKFPMLRTRDIKILLSEIVQADVQDQSEAEFNIAIEKLRQKQEREAATVEQEAVMTPTTVDVPPPPPAPAAEGRAVSKGGLQGFIAKHMNLSTDWAERGSIAREGKRLFVEAQKQGIKTTQGSMTVALSVVVRSMGFKTGHRGGRGDAKVKVPSVPKVAAVVTRAPAVTRATRDDFEELDTLIGDAIAALKLVQEHMPKVRKETERLRGMREKMLRMLED